MCGALHQRNFMKANKIIYWTTTILVSAGMAMSSAMYLTSNPKLVQGFAMLGYPQYIIYLLGILKLLGAVALVVPGFPRIKEWAYAGFVFCFVGALWSHVATHTPFMGPVMFLALLVTSYVFYHRVRSSKVEYNKTWATA